MTDYGKQKQNTYLLCAVNDEEALGSLSWSYRDLFLRGAD